MTNPLQVTVEFDSLEQAEFLALFLRRIWFDDCYAKTEPHRLGEERKERAYKMLAALSKVQTALEDANVSA